MPSKLLFVIDAHTIFEDSSFSYSKDIGVRILKIWASSAILDLTVSGFWQFCSFSGATEYQAVKFDRNLSTCGWVRVMYPFFQCRTLGALIGQMDLRVGEALAAWGLRQMRTQTSALYTFVWDFFYFFAPFLNQSASNASGVENGAQFHTF